jgi:hypothetical protein
VLQLAKPHPIEAYVYHKQLIIDLVAAFPPLVNPDYQEPEVHPLAGVTEHDLNF